VREAKAQLSHLLARVAAGEEIVIARAGLPVARLLPVLQRPPGLERAGRFVGKGRVANDFGAPLPDELLALFSK
jgi:prevent-host-death family protein